MHFTVKKQKQTCTHLHLTHIFLTIVAGLRRLTLGALPTSFREKSPAKMKKKTKNKKQKQKKNNNKKTTKKTQQQH